MKPDTADGTGTIPHVHQGNMDLWNEMEAQTVIGQTGIVGFLPFAFKANQSDLSRRLEQFFELWASRDFVLLCSSVLQLQQTLAPLCTEPFTPA